MLALNVDVKSFPVKKPKDVFQGGSKQFRRYYVSMPHFSLLLYSCIGFDYWSCRRPDTAFSYKNFQLFNIPVVDLAPLERLQHCPRFNRIESFFIVHKRQAQWEVPFFFHGIGGKRGDVSPGKRFVMTLENSLYTWLRREMGQ